MKPAIKPIGRKTNLVIQELKDETLVYDLEANRAVCLNSTSALIWKNCIGTVTTKDIADQISVETGTLVSEHVVLLAVDQLFREGLLENGDSIRVYSPGMSRRLLIRKIGFSSIVALPMISSILAPSSIEAQSCLLAGNDSVVCFNNGVGCVPNPNPSGFPSSLCPEPRCCSGTCEAGPLINDVCV